MSTEQKEKESEEYQFIQEKVIPKKKKKWKKALSLTVAAIVLGAVFGLTGSAVFCLSEPWMMKLLGREPEESGTEGVQLSEKEPGEDSGEEDSDKKEPEKEGKEDKEENPDGNPTGEDKEENPDNNSQNPDENNSTEPDENENNGEPAKEKETVIIEQTILGEISDFSNIYHEIGMMASEVNSAIVKVTGVTSGLDWFQNPYETEASTSGLIVAADEKHFYILVSYSRIEQGNEIRITFEQTISAPAFLRDAQPDMGLAVVAVRKSDLPEELSERLEPAQLGESYSLEVGEPVIALGNPNGYLYSMLLGIVTNKANYAYIADNRLELFHTDMLLGSEGEGVIVNMQGRIVGIITRQLGENQQFCKALSISRIKSVLESMINQRPRVYMGIIGMDLQPTLAKKLQVSGGVYVANVESDSPAELAGMKQGDVIVQFGEEPVLAISAFSSALQGMMPGDEVTVKFYRMIRNDAVEQETVVVLGQKNLSQK